jgi:hypothetical protein
MGKLRDCVASLEIPTICLRCDESGFCDSLRVARRICHPIGFLPALQNQRRVARFNRIDSSGGTSDRHIDQGSQGGPSLVIILSVVVVCLLRRRRESAYGSLISDRSYSGGRPVVDAAAPTPFDQTSDLATFVDETTLPGSIPSATDVGSNLGSLGRDGDQ